MGQGHCDRHPPCFPRNICCIRRSRFPLGNLSEVGAQHVNSVSHDSVKPILFCFFCQVGSLWIPLLYGKQRKKRSVLHLYGPGWVQRFDGAYRYTCSYGRQPWVWCLTTPQAYSRSTTCTLLHYIRVDLGRLFSL